MSIPELTTFGSLVRFALQLEGALEEFYGALGAQAMDDALRGTAVALAQDHRERGRFLERARQQFLNEVILEPVTGLDGARYAVETSLPPMGEAVRRAILLEETSARFYSESAAMAETLLAEAARAFRRLAEGNGRNVERLRALRVTAPAGRIEERP